MCPKSPPIFLFCSWLLPPFNVRFVLPQTSNPQTKKQAPSRRKGQDRASFLNGCTEDVERSSVCLKKGSDFGGSRYLKCSREMVSLKVQRQHFVPPLLRDYQCFFVSICTKLVQNFCDGVAVTRSWFANHKILHEISSFLF